MNRRISYKDIRYHFLKSKHHGPEERRNVNIKYQHVAVSGLQANPS